MVRALKDVKWDEFTITNILGNSINSKAWHSKDLEFNNFDNNIGIPYITRTSLNNGLYGLVVPNSKYVLNPANSISLGAENAQYFVQPFRFITGNKMYYYHRDNLSLEALKFIVVCLNKSLKDAGFGFGLGLTGTRSNNRKLMLPITKTGEPDYKFMEEYIKEREAKLKERYKSYVQARVEELTNGINPVPKWGDYKIQEIFPVLVPGKSKGLNHLKQTDTSGISYLGATNRNNGVLSFVEKNGNEHLIQKGNCIAFIRNGEGSMGYSIYKSEDFIATSDITLGYNKKLNRYSGMFITTIADRVRGKYSFNYKRSDSRLKKEILSLPVTANGEPNYTYMENYMKYLEKKKLLEYLNYIK